MKKNISSFLIIFVLVGFFSLFLINPKTYAEGETITLNRIGAEKNSQTNKWDWRFTIDTTGGVENSDIVMKIYKGNITTDGSNIIDTRTVGKLKNNHAEPNTDFILDEGETYSVSFLINMTPVLHSYYKNIAGDNSTQGDVINFTPQTNDPGGDDTYNLLAPIPGLEEAVNTNDIGKYFNTIFLIAIGLCGALAVIMIVIGGIQYMGDESIFAKTEAKSRIKMAIFGLIIALAAYALLNTINPDLLGGGGLNIKQVTAEIDPEAESEPWAESMTITGTTKSCEEGYTNVTTHGNGSAGQPKTINVCKSVSANLKKLLDKAKEKGYIISGYGSRSYDRQVQLRRDHNCPDIYNSPSNKCRPPTARPGHSKHESGKAVDFTCNGSKMAGSVCFQWLKDNAKAYGFYNLRSEPWHWSDDGH